MYLRWEALVVAAALLLAIFMWAAHLGAMPVSERSEDVLYVMLAIVPGAIVGGRLFHVLSFTEAYVGQEAAVLDLSRGSLSLAGAVVGGALAGVYVCRLLGERVGSWADAAAGPLLVALGVGKLGLILGGSGQGLPFDGAWAVAFDGPGPWVSADAGTPAHPAQVYEGAWILLGGAAVSFFARAQRASDLPRLDFERRWWVDGRVFLIAIAWWLAGRSIIASIWRDEPRIGPLGIEQALAMAGAIIVAAWLVVVTIRARSGRGADGVSWGRTKAKKRGRHR